MKLKKGDLNGAIADCNQAIKLDPNHGKAYQTRAIAERRKGDLNGALADYNQAIELYERNPVRSVSRLRRTSTKTTAGPRQRDAYGSFATFVGI